MIYTIGWVIKMHEIFIKGNLGHYYSALYVFSENMGHPQPMKIVIVNKCLKLLRIYGITTKWSSMIFKFNLYQK